MVLNGPDGKIVIDTFLLPAWPKLKENLDGLGNAPLKTVIDTHWHVDHTDNNANLYAAGATVLAHDNTKTRMAEPHDSALFGLHFPASPADALPQETFSSSKNCTPTVKLYCCSISSPRTPTRISTFTSRRPT